MPQECRQTAQRRHAHAQTERRAIGQYQRHRQPTFHRIEQQGQDGGLFAARAQHIGSAGVFAAVLAGVVQAHQAADNHGKAERAQQITGQHRKRWKHEVHGGCPCLFIGRYSASAQFTVCAPNKRTQAWGSIPTK